MLYLKILQIGGQSSEHCATDHNAVVPRVRTNVDHQLYVDKKEDGIFTCIQSSQILGYYPGL